MLTLRRTPAISALRPAPEKLFHSRRFSFPQRSFFVLVQHFLVLCAMNGMCIARAVLALLVCPSRHQETVLTAVKFTLFSRQAHQVAAVFCSHYHPFVDHSHSGTLGDLQPRDVNGSGPVHGRSSTVPHDKRQWLGLIRLILLTFFIGCHGGAYPSAFFPA